MSVRSETRENYKYFYPIQTRWNDNDIYGHVNNVIYYAYFDTVVNMFMVDNAGFDPHNARVIGICPETHCNYHKPVAYPDKLEAGLRIGLLGNSSVRYEIAIFIAGDREAAATGRGGTKVKTAEYSPPGEGKGGARLRRRVRLKR